MKLPSSTDGIIEYEAAHFDNQMRGNLIVAKYNQGLSRIILAPGGRSVLPASIPEIKIGGQGSLSIAQAPDGTIVSARFNDLDLWCFEPIEPATSKMSIKSCFPRRGGLAGGTRLNIYGVNFSGTPTVTVGGKVCSSPIVVSSKKITCVLPLGSIGAVDVTVATGADTSAMTNGYRYIRGRPENPRC